MKKSLIATLLLMLPLLAFGAKKGYKITFIADGNTDSVLYMGHFHAQYRYFCDTAVALGKGRFVFEGKTDLKPGLYYLTNNKDRYVQFVVYNESQRFTLHTDDSNWKLRMTVKGSNQNEVFFNFHRAEEVIFQDMEEARRTLDSVTFATQERQKYITRLDSLRMEVINKYPEHLISRMMMATKDITVPRKHEDGTAMTDRERYDWQMAHYFDNIPLNEPFIIRTPSDVFYKRVMDYVDVYMKGMAPEMICPLLDSMIDRAEPAQEVYRWLILNMTDHFLKSRVMVYDEVYVHLVQRYFATGKVVGLSPSIIDEQVTQANKWERLLVGKVAPELILFDTMHNPHSLHHMPGRYTLLLFWSPTCGHCREIVPAVYKVFEEYADSLQVSAFAILSEPDDQTVVKWKKFLEEHSINSPWWVNLNGAEANVDWREVYDITSTPQIYLIDNADHKFVAKKLNAEILSTILRALMKENSNK